MPEQQRDGKNRDWDEIAKACWLGLRARAIVHLRTLQPEELRRFAVCVKDAYEKSRNESNAGRGVTVGPSPVVSAAVEEAANALIARREPPVSGPMVAFATALTLLAFSLEANVLLGRPDPTSSWDPGTQSFEDMFKTISEARAS